MKWKWGLFFWPYLGKGSVSCSMNEIEQLAIWYADVQSLFPQNIISMLGIVFENLWHWFLLLLEIFHGPARCRALFDWACTMYQIGLSCFILRRKLREWGCTFRIWRRIAIACVTVQVFWLGVLNSLWLTCRLCLLDLSNQREHHGNAWTGKNVFIWWCRKRRIRHHQSLVRYHEQRCYK